MKLSKKQFEELLQREQLTLTLIGMSNVGKTYWSKKLSELNFEHLNCDDLIEAKLAPELKALGYSGIEDVSRWMGQPYDGRFAANQQKYLEFEKQVLQRILSDIKKSKTRNTVIDTTGSFVHTGEGLCSKIKENTLIIYIEAPKSMREEMFKRYMENPKPVVFGNLFSKEKNETDKEALGRAYLKLLDSRSQLYTKYADIIIPYGSINTEVDPEKFISLVEKYL